MAHNPRSDTQEGELDDIELMLDDLSGVEDDDENTDEQSDAPIVSLIHKILLDAIELHAYSL